MKPIKLKVCGMCLPHQVQQLIRWEVDYIGFIFYKMSPRYVLDHLTTKEIAKFPHNGKVGVFVNESINNVLRISQEAKLNVVQLHGNETSEYIKELKQSLPNVKIVKSIAMNTNPNIAKSPFIDAYLLDKASAAYGGSGEHFNWQDIQQLNIQQPYILSGGISPMDLEAIFKLNPQPITVDINSKFEKTAGLKDLKLIEFMIHELKKFNNDTKTT